MGLDAVKGQLQVGTLLAGYSSAEAKVSSTAEGHHYFRLQD